MNFRTIVDIPPSTFRIPPFEKMLFVGSCFADNMGRRFLAEKFQAVVNPYGVMYNPASVWHTVRRCREAPRVAVLTLGTNHVYTLKETGEIVDNCKKRPHHLFDEKCLSVDECVDYLSRTVGMLTARYADVRVIVTVSPIRYAKYGFHGSGLSKATLLLAADRLVELYPEHAVYFPAYEIINDELRDYRFYKEDMLHPTEQAVDYIWQRFGETFFSVEAHAFMKEWKDIKKALAHRPLEPENQAYRDFMRRTEEKLSGLERKYGVKLT